MFSDVPPDTSAYMIAGYVIFFLVTAIYLASLFIRTRNLDRDLLTLENMHEEEERESPAAPPAPVRAPGTPKARRPKSGKPKQPQKRKTARKK